MSYSEHDIEQLAKGIFDGDIRPDELPEDLYLAIAEYLKKALYEGYGGTLADFEGREQTLLMELRENVYMFSAAKTFQQVKDMSELLTDGENVRSYSDFREAFRDTYDQYNENWLEAEYNTAIGEAQSALKWDNIERNKDILPLLKYSAVMDDHTSDLCAELDDLVLPVDDPFWDEYMPPNHFNCRCVVEQLEEDEEKQTDDDEVKEAVEAANVPEEFRFNPGKEGRIFSNDHPYFDVPKEDREFARNNFGLPIPDNDE